MGIAACIVRAVAVLVVGASRHAIIGRLVGKVATVAVGARAGAEERLAHGHFVGVVIEATLGAERADTCEEC